MPTCVAPRHEDASRDLFYFLFSPNEQRAGGGEGALPDFFFFPLFSRPRAGLATVLSSFCRVGNQCAECEKQQQQQLMVSSVNLHLGGIASRKILKP